MPEIITNDSLFYENDQHQGALLEMMKSMYDQGELADVTLLVDDAKFPCHRNVLAATSPYFRAMFTNDLTESRNEKVQLYETDGLSVKLIIDYAYTGKINITKNNAQNLLAASSLFHVSPIIKACAKFMETQLDVTNCIGIHYFAQIHSCDDLRIKAKEHIDKNFPEVSDGEEFMQLSEDKVAELVSSNDLNVEKEEIVFEAIMRWLNHDADAHLPHLSKLLPHIRFSLLSPRYLKENVCSNLLIMQCDKSRKIIDNLSDLEKNRELYDSSQVTEVNLRSGMIKPEPCILLMGGVDQNRADPTINCYNPLTREAYHMANLFQEVGSNFMYYDVEMPACVVTDENTIFVGGGSYIYRESHAADCAASDEDSLEEEYDEETARKEFYQYDNDHDTWIPRQPMLFPKSNFTLASVDQSIYCFGGLTLNQHPTEIIEKYDISANRWNYVCMMPTTLVDLASVVHNGLIYILGGRTGVGAHNVVLRFDPKRVEWKHLAGMPTPRFNLGACVIANEIYVVGGQIYSHTSHTINREALRSVEVYNIETNQWRQGPNLPEDMYNVGLVQIDQSLYAAGTTEYHRSAYRIYRYNVVWKLDLQKSTWTQVEGYLCNIRDFVCIGAKMHTRKLSQVFRPEVDT